MFLLSSISNANRVQAQPGSLRYPSPKNSPPDCFSRRNCVSPVGSFESPLLQFDKKRRSHNGTFFFWRRRGDSLRYPSPKNSPPDCFSRKSFRFFGRLIRVPPFSNSIKKKVPQMGPSFLAEKGGLEPPRQFLDRPTPLAGAPRHQLEYFSRLVSGLRLYSLLETAVLNSFLFLCR